MANFSQAEGDALTARVVVLEAVLGAATARLTALEAEATTLRITATSTLATALEIERKRQWMMDRLQSHVGGYSVIPPEPNPYT